MTTTPSAAVAVPREVLLQVEQLIQAIVFLIPASNYKANTRSDEALRLLQRYLNPNPERGETCSITTPGCADSSLSRDNVPAGVAAEGEWKPKPWSYWYVWYECLRTIVRIDDKGTGFFAFGQEPIWCLNNAKPIMEIQVSPTFNPPTKS